MDRNAFWHLIDAARTGEPGETSARLVHALARLPADDIVDFAFHWDAVRATAYRNDLWAAAYLMNGGCSDDGFTDFRSWLALQGRAIYDAALSDPDSLAALGALDGASDECYPASDAYARATGDKVADVYALIAAKHGHTKHPALPDDDWTFDFDDADEMRDRLPRLFALYSDADD